MNTGMNDKFEIFWSIIKKKIFLEDVNLSSFPSYEIQFQNYKIESYINYI